MNTPDTSAGREKARQWVIDRLRFPQRSPRTTAIFDWTAVTPGTQRALAALTATIVDPDQLVARPRWWHALTGQEVGFRELTDSQRTELRGAYSSLHWPLREEGPEIRLVAIAENALDRIIGDPAWAHPALDGHRSVLGFTIELHMIASHAHELLRLRASTPAPPPTDGGAQLDRARAEWDRRQAVTAQARAGLIDRVAALRAYEQALTPIAGALHTLDTINSLRSGGGDVDRIYRQITGSAAAAEHTHALRHDLDDAAAGLGAQIAYLDSLVGEHRNA